MVDETESTTRPRASRFKEHTNTNSSIRPPPDELWKDLGIEVLLEQFNEENRAPPLSRKTSGEASVSKGHAASRVADEPLKLRPSSESRAPKTHEALSIARTPGNVGAPSVINQGVSTLAAPTTPAPAASEGTFGRFQRAFASVFGGVLGKRKAGNADTEKEKEKKVLDERKKAADAAYQEAKALGLLPTPKVFVRPGAVTKSRKSVSDAPTPVRAPRTPKLHCTPSKRDLQKQMRLSKKVSELELKLASAKKDLQSALHNDELPPIPPLPAVLPPTPNASQSENDNDTPPHRITDPAPIAPLAVSPAPAPSPVLAPNPAPASAPQPSAKKITKKRKAVDEEDHKPATADLDGDIDMALSPSEQEEAVAPKRTVKRVKSSTTPSRKTLKKQPSSPRLRLKRSKTTLIQEQPVTVIPDGVSVPLVPKVPRGVKGKKVEVRDDGYGGLEHEMF